MKRITAFIVAIVVALRVAGCGTAQDSSSDVDSTTQSQILHSDELLVKEVEEKLGTEYLTYANEKFVVYRGDSSVYMDDGSGRLKNYIFNTKHKTGHYRIEIFDDVDWDSNEHIILRMEDGTITDVLKFYSVDEAKGFGNDGKTDVASDEKLLVGKVYFQRSGTAINFDFLEDVVHITENKILDLGEFYNPMAISEDGMYSIYSRCQYKPDETCELRNNTTGEIIVLDKGEYHNVGFLPDGNICIMNNDDYKVFSTSGEEIFSLSDNFYTGLVDEAKEIYRKICGVYRDENNGRYYVVYFDHTGSGYVQGTHMLQDCYRMAVLDFSGALKEIIETEKYAETYNSRYSEVSIRSVNEHTVSFYIERNNVMDFEVYVDIETHEISLKDYRTWNQPME